MTEEKKRQKLKRQQCDDAAHLSCAPLDGDTPIVELTGCDEASSRTHAAMEGVTHCDDVCASVEDVADVELLRRVLKQAAGQAVGQAVGQVMGHAMGQSMRPSEGTASGADVR